MTTKDATTTISTVARQYLQLQLAADVGPIRVRNLVSHFGSIEEAIAAPLAALQSVVGITPRAAESICQARADGLVDREVDRATECDLRILCIEDPAYPHPLRNIPDPPMCLYVRGQLEPTDSVAVAIVGTRRCSHYGREQAIRFGEALGAAGFTVVSGLARGIDGHAHQGAIQGGGRTIAVLGNGLSSIYPREHEALAERIANAGAVVSEIPVDTQPSAGNFPRRNRIIAGLSLGVIVIEAGLRSGALITARLTTEYNREVFALPGRVDRPDVTAGVHGLIRDGQAKLIVCLEDVLDELGEVGEVMGRETISSTGEKPPEPSVQTSPALPPEEQAVLDAVLDDARDVDSIVSRTGLETGRVISILTSLQVKGRIQRRPGSQFACRSSKSRASSKH